MSPQLTQFANPSVAYHCAGQFEHAVCELSCLPAGHLAHVVAGVTAFTTEPPPQLEQAVTVPVVEDVPAPHALFVVAPPDAGHSKPPGHGEHVAPVATPAAS